MGNRISTTANGAVTAYVTNSMNEYTSVGGVAYTYDADGNLLSDGTATYTYNAFDELTGSTQVSGAVTSYAYNALGQRVSSTTSGVLTRDVIDPISGVVIAEADGVEPDP